MDQPVMKKHWAAGLIGRPWTPDENCWWLVRHVFRTRYGVEMPDIVVREFGEAENVAAIKRAASASGWRPADGEPRDGDVVLMRGSLLGKRHVGVMIDTSQGLRLLHSDGFMTARGPVGSVAAQPLRDVLASGYGEVELW